MSLSSVVVLPVAMPPETPAKGIRILDKIRVVLGVLE